jgi:hypothetical protein
VDWDAGTLELLRANLTVGTTGLLGRTVALGGDQALHVGQAVTVQQVGTLSVTGDASTLPDNDHFSSGSLVNFGTSVFTQVQVDVDADGAGNGLVNDGRLVLIDAELSGEVVNTASMSLIGNSVLRGEDFQQLSGGLLEVGVDQPMQLGALLDFETAEIAGDLEFNYDQQLLALRPYESFVLLDAAELSGTFAAITGGVVGAAEALAVTYTATGVEVTRAILGDADLSGQIGQADLNAVLGNWGAIGQTWATGDFNGDGLVAQADLNAVLSNWGQQAAPDLQGLPVPEPAALTVLTPLLLTLRRRRA